MTKRELPRNQSLSKRKDGAQHNGRAIISCQLVERRETRTQKTQRDRLRLVEHDHGPGEIVQPPAARWTVRTNYVSHALLQNRKAAVTQKEQSDSKIPDRELLQRIVERVTVHTGTTQMQLHSNHVLPRCCASRLTLVGLCL